MTKKTDLIEEIEMLKHSEKMRASKVNKFIADLENIIENTETEANSIEDRKQRSKAMEAKGKLFSMHYNLVRTKTKEAQVSEANFESLRMVISKNVK